jgi:hypothetical protein
VRARRVTSCAFSARASSRRPCERSSRALLTHAAVQAQPLPGGQPWPARQHAECCAGVERRDRPPSGPLGRTMTTPSRPDHVPRVATIPVAPTLVVSSVHPGNRSGRAEPYRSRPSQRVTRDRRPGSEAAREAPGGDRYTPSVTHHRAARSARLAEAITRGHDVRYPTYRFRSPGVLPLCGAHRERPRPCHRRTPVGGRSVMRRPGAGP